MNKKHILKQVMYRSTNPTPGDKRFIRMLWLCIPPLITFPFALLITGNSIFGWFMYATMGIILVIEISALIWRVRDIIKQMKANEQEE
jgi:hypothetical protein